MSVSPSDSGRWALFVPKLVTVLGEGYGPRDFRQDFIAGLTVAIVALPLAMALAIASGTTPDKGIVTAVVAGFLISALGGSRFQIGGPTGAFVVVVFNVIAKHGYDGLVLSTLMAGFLLIGAGLLRVGTFIKYMPQPVITGFTAGIAVIIASSQIKDFFGLAVANFLLPSSSPPPPSGSSAFRPTPSVRASSGSSRASPCRIFPPSASSASPSFFRAPSPSRSSQASNRFSPRSSPTA